MDYFPNRFHPHSYSTSDLSLVPKVVEIWREDLTSKNRQKLAARIASPSEQPDAFTEGWEGILETEHSSRPDNLDSVVQ